MSQQHIQQWTKELARLYDRRTSEDIAWHGYY